MSMKPSRHLTAALCLAAAAQLASAPAAAQRPRAPVTVNFVNADIDAVARAFAAMIDRQIAVDPRVKGQITVYSEQPQSVQQAYQTFQTALRGLGFAVIESGGLLKIVPEADAKLQTGTVSVGESGVRGDQVITQIFQLRYENPNNLVAVLRPLISANNTINSNPGSSSLVITDYADNLQRIARIIAALDQPTATDLEVVPLQHAVASDLAPLVQRLAETGSTVTAPGAAAGAGGTTVVADARSNSLIIRAPNAARLAGVRAAIAKLDRPASGLGPSGGLWVVHLKNADAVKLATVLRAAFGTSGGSGSTGSTTPGSLTTATTTQNTPPSPGNQNNSGAASAQATAPVTASGQPTTGGFIQADPATNSLIITAPEPLYRQVRAMIEQLDSRRAQVYIESLIVEVAGDNAAEFGFQWQGLLGKDGDSTGLFAGTNFSNTGGNILSITTAAASGNTSGLSVGEGLNIGLLKRYGGTYALGALATLLQSQTNTNIVSTPNLVTLDNEEAKIVVGENVPFITGQYTNTGTSTSSPFQTIERKDVGITLRIRPQIGESGTVRMTIYQEQSSVLSTATVGTSNAGPSTTKRSIESQVVVEDGQIIVLGGLVQDSYVEEKSKVPLLGDLPGIGALFRSESRTKKRTNLMVFLRPVVMRDADSSAKLSLDRYDQIRARQQDAQPIPSTILRIDEAPVLPTLPNTTPQPAQPAKPPLVEPVAPAPNDVTPATTP
ncbi:type II secretion system secretin GspD [Rubrivivax gelatinosus]|uniref:Type II secretion system protein GspD n=1 Tax=Rubrivivax gelatinosus TaxID=28068 RepID=A0ABS1DT03_RUBGE|nr:type II secretion system protein GspD [Rubrivivax gelatinosus]